MIQINFANNPLMGTSCMTTARCGGYQGNVIPDSHFPETYIQEEEYTS